MNVCMGAILPPDVYAILPLDECSHPVPQTWTSPCHTGLGQVLYADSAYFSDSHNPVPTPRRFSLVS